MSEWKKKKKKKMFPLLPWQWLQQHGILVNSVLLSLPLLALMMLITYKAASPNKSRFPPSPPKLPIIGNLHQMGSSPHRSLRSLSRKHGPLMLLQLGQIPTLVISSADTAKEILKTNDLAFASRPCLEVPKLLTYGNLDVAFAPYGEYWRNIRRICVVHLLSAKRVQSYKLVREEEAAFMTAKIARLSSTSGVVDLSEIFNSFSHGLICRVASGESYSEGGMNNVFRKLIEENVNLIAAFHVGDYFPSLRWLNAFTGLDARVKKTLSNWDRILDEVIDEHVKRSQLDDNVLHHKDFVDVLLDLQKDHSMEFPLAKESIKAILLDTFAAGIGTSYITLEWAMAELVRSPEVMKKAQREVREIARAKPAVGEDDLSQMSYLRAVIKETLRLHPPATLLLPREAGEDTRIQGYEIPKKTRVIVNAWAIGRDPEFWEAAEEFRPERFIGKAVDFRGSDFQFIPFGAGRRVCPGMQFAVCGVELGLANLLHQFDWEMPGGMPGEALDMTETYGLTTRRKLDLHLVATPRA